jgi:hypothetical protein
MARGPGGLDPDSHFPLKLGRRFPRFSRFLYSLPQGDASSNHMDARGRARDYSIRY